MEVWIGIVLGVWLSVGDWIAIEEAQHSGNRKIGLKYWLALVLFPLVLAAIFAPWKATLIGVALGTVISGLVWWCKKQEKLGSKASRLYLML